MEFYELTSTIIDEPESILIYRTRYWVVDTVAGKTRKAFLVTITDRYYHFLKIQKVSVKRKASW